jgi:hypothetical protein
VNGNLRLDGELVFNAGYSIQSYNNSPLSINAQGNNILLNENGYGNVGIGTTAPNQKLHVAGNILATGEISANVLNQGSDIRFKDMISDVTLNLDTIANAPMFRFTWNNTDDKKVYIGSSAQYWKNYASELVSIDKDDFHRLDYSTLGVLIGVTLAKTTKNHEDRIKELEAKVESLEQENRRLTYGK